MEEGWAGVRALLGKGDGENGGREVGSGVGKERREVRKGLMRGVERTGEEVEGGGGRKGS